MSDHLALYRLAACDQCILRAAHAEERVRIHRLAIGREFLPDGPEIRLLKDGSKIDLANAQLQKTRRKLQGYSRSSVKHERKVGGFMDSRQSVKLDGSLASGQYVNVAYRHAQRINSRLFGKAPGRLRIGHHCVSVPPRMGQPSHRSFHRHSRAMSEAYGLLHQTAVGFDFQ